MSTTAQPTVTVSTIERRRTVGEFSADFATVTGEHGSTECTGCVGVSPSGRYRVYTTWRLGPALLGSSTVVDADSAIEAAIFAASRAGGSYVSCQAGTVEVA